MLGLTKSQIQTQYPVKLDIKELANTKCPAALPDGD